MHYTLNILIFFCVILKSISAFLPNDNDTATIHNRVLELMIWPPRDQISDTIQSALSYTEALNSSCYWPDVNYTDKNIVLWNTAEHMYRITTMLQALTVKGSTVRNNTRLRSAAHCALNVWLVNDWKNPNWWYNDIKIPLQATSQLLMLGDNATSFEIEKIKEISFRAAWWNRGNDDSGANLVWMIQIQLYRSLATNNLTGIEQGFNRMWEDLKISARGGEAVQNDWAYHFHGQQLLSGSYGIIWVSDILAFLVCSNHTKYQPDQSKLELFGDFLTKGDAWMIIGNEWDYHCLGRAVSRADKENHVGIDITSLKVLASELKSTETKTDLLNFIDRLTHKENASLLIGNKHFYTSDYQIHRRRNWSAGIKMQSTRTQPDECINGENQKAEHTGQGLLYLYGTTTDDYYYIFPLFDWQALNGITVEHDIPLEHCTNGSFPLKKLDFVTGVSDSQYGLAVMDTASHNLTAQRSWHFYDDAIIALATNLTLPTTTTAWTTLASRLIHSGQITIGFFNSTIVTLVDGNYSFPYTANSTSNVQWIHISESDIGYLLQMQSRYHSLGIDFGNKTGNFKTIGAFDHNVTARMLTLWLDHGQGPYTRDYNYIILPNVSLESIPNVIKQYDEEHIFSCMSTNNLFHGIMWPSLKRASFVLWENMDTIFSCHSPSFQLTIQLNDAGAYLFSENEHGFTITASHPTRINSTLEVLVDRTSSGRNCVGTTNTTVTLTLPVSSEFLGASVNVTCNYHTINTN